MKRFVLLSVSIFGWGFSVFLNKLASKHYHPYHLQVIWNSLSIIIIPFFLMMSYKSNVTFSHSLKHSLLALTAVVFSIVATTCFYFAIKESEVGKSLIITSAYPVVTLILSCIFLGEQINGARILGILFVFVGLFIISAK